MVFQAKIQCDPSSKQIEESCYFFYLMLSFVYSQLEQMNLNLPSSLVQP